MCAITIHEKRGHASEGEQKGGILGRGGRRKRAGRNINKWQSQNETKKAGKRLSSLSVKS